MSDRRTPTPLALPSLSLGLGLCVLLLCAVGAAHADARPPGEAKAQLSFGVDMARRGLWREALFRFNEAQRLAPDSTAILNNLAVAYEATGEFEKALDYYQRALKVSPSDRNLRNNYARFIEFYQSFQNAKKKRPAVAGKPPGANPASTPSAPPPRQAPALVPPTLGDPILRPQDEPHNPVGPADIPPPPPTL